MKTLTNVKIQVKDGKVTLTADIEDKAFSFPVQQVTVGYLNPENMKWPRHIQLSHEAVFVKAFGNGFAISQDDLVRLAAAVEPKTSYAPVFKKTENLTVEISSELDPELQWQVSERIDKLQQWVDIPGEKSASLSRKPELVGKFVRCRASSDAGFTTTIPVKMQ